MLRIFNGHYMTPFDRTTLVCSISVSLLLLDLLHKFLNLVLLWNSLLKQDIVKVESVQRRFAKRLKGLHNLPYTIRLSNLGFDSLHCRRTKPDLSIYATKLLIIMHALSLLPLLLFHYQVKLGVTPKN